MAGPAPAAVGPAIDLPRLIVASTPDLAAALAPNVMALGAGWMVVPASAAPVEAIGRGEYGVVHLDAEIDRPDLLAAAKAAPLSTLIHLPSPEAVTRAELWGAIGAAKTFSEKPPTAPARHQGLLGVADIFAPLPPVRWLCQSIEAAPGAPLLITGYGFSGKTVAAQDLALAVATGTQAWGRFDVARAGRVLHLDFEQGSHLTRQRYQRLAKARGIVPADLEDRLLLAPFPGWYLDSDVDDELARLCEGTALLIVDSFRAACPHTDENSSEARIPLDRLTRIAEAAGVVPVVIHHSRKPTKDAVGGARMSMRGSGALYDACGSHLVFSAEKGEPITVEHEKARITGQTREDFRLQIEDVAINGDPLAGLRVSCLDLPPSPKKQAPAAKVEAARTEIVRLLINGPAASRDSIRERIGKGAGLVRAALAELISEGVVMESGTTKDKRISLVSRESP